MRRLASPVGEFERAKRYLFAVVLLSFFFLSFSKASLLSQEECPKLVPLKKPNVILPDKFHHVYFLATPKAGATIATQIIFSSQGLLQEARKYGYDQVKNAEIPEHFYRAQVFAQHNLGCDACTQGWTCIKLIRSPMERVVSSYFHSVVRYNLLSRPGIHHNSTFADFVISLPQGENGKLSSGREGHFLPQVTTACDPHLDYLIPLEDLTTILPQLNQLLGTNYNDTNLNSGHYLRDKLRDDTNFDATRTGGLVLLEKLPHYSRYFVDKELNKLICCLYQDDFVDYQKACFADWLKIHPDLNCRKKVKEHRALCGTHIFSDFG